MPTNYRRGSRRVIAAAVAAAAAVVAARQANGTVERVLNTLMLRGQRSECPPEETRTKDGSCQRVVTQS